VCVCVRCALPQTKVHDMKTALEGRIQRAEEIGNTLRHFKREVALAAAHSKTGAPISQKQLADIEAKGEGCAARRVGAAAARKHRNTPNPGTHPATHARPPAACLVDSPPATQSARWRRRCSACG
jgi:hypothetical protein